MPGKKEIHRDVRHRRNLLQPCLEDAGFYNNRRKGLRHRDDLVGIEPHVPCAYEIELAVDHAGTDDQGDRDHELAHDQDPADGHVSGARESQAAKRLDRCDSGQVKGRIAARGKPHHGADHHDGTQGEPGGIRIQGHGLAREQVEPRQAQHGKQEGNANRKPGHEHGLADELPDHLASGRAEGLSQADFPGPSRGPRGGQVHEVDTRDEDDEYGDGAEEVDVTDIAVRGQFPLEMRVKMDIRDRLQPEGQ